MQNIKLLLAYDGSSYCGWQKTATGPSIEESLQVVLEKILQHSIVLQAASRTDAGVHADGQVVNFSTHKQALDTRKLLIGANSLLPSSIRILEISLVGSAFHATLDNIGKEYHYHVCTGTVQLPKHRFYSWHCHHPLNLSNMLEGTRYLIGKHDFKAFCNEKNREEYADHIRELQRIDIQEEPGERFLFRIKGNQFLYKMVRNIVGTLVYVGAGKLHSADLPQILASRDRTLAGVTAPAHGLFLHTVFY
jgi:tRNA pseudouridine38-40 synthase